MCSKLFYNLCFEDSTCMYLYLSVYYCVDYHSKIINVTDEYKEIAHTKTNTVKS